MSLDSPKNYKIIEPAPGEKIWAVIARCLRERADSDSDLILQIEIKGEMKEVIITQESTQQSVSEALYN